MKKFLDAMFVYFEMLGRARTASMLSRMGKHKEAAVLMGKD